MLTLFWDSVKILLITVLCLLLQNGSIQFSLSSHRGVYLGELHGYLRFFSILVLSPTEFLTRKVEGGKSTLTRCWSHSSRQGKAQNTQALCLQCLNPCGPKDLHGSALPKTCSIQHKPWLQLLQPTRSLRGPDDKFMTPLSKYFRILLQRYWRENLIILPSSCH